MRSAPNRIATCKYLRCKIQRSHFDQRIRHATTKLHHRPLCCSETHRPSLHGLCRVRTYQFCSLFDWRRQPLPPILRCNVHWHALMVGFHHLPRHGVTRTRGDCAANQITSQVSLHEIDARLGLPYRETHLELGLDSCLPRLTDLEIFLMVTWKLLFFGEVVGHE